MLAAEIMPDSNDEGEGAGQKEIPENKSCAREWVG